MVTNTEIQFLLVDESHTYALSRLETRWAGLLLLCDAVKLRGCISWPVWPLRSINKTAWVAKLILTAHLAYPVSCASLGHLLMAQHCYLCLNVCFSPPTAPHSPPPPTPPPIPYRFNPQYYSHLKKLPQKPKAFK